MEVFKLISRILVVLHRGFDIAETFIELLNRKDTNNVTDKNNK